MTDQSPSEKTWIAGGAVTVFVFLAGLFIKEQTDMSAINQREADHAEELNRRIGTIESAARDIQEQRERIDDALGKRIDAVGLGLGQRIDIANDRLNEIQRQTSAIEGKLGESLPSLAPLKPKD